MPRLLYMQLEVFRDHPSRPWSYMLLEAHQAKARDSISQGGSGRLILSEVSPVITLGKRAKLEQELRTNAVELEKLGIAVHFTSRGGLATYHGPGQWILFPTDRLEKLTGDSCGVRKLILGLLEVALNVGKKYDPSAEIKLGRHLGVWIKQGKFASIGVHIEKGIVLHGMAINGFKTPLSFYGLRPCGLNEPIGFLLGDSQKAEAFDELGRRIVQTFGSLFKIQF